VVAAAAEPVESVVLYGRNNFNGGYELGKRLLEEHAGVTAVFAANDTMAFGVLRAMLEAGRRIPDDVSVIGFDNVEFAGIVYPPLTTIHQPKYETGEAAVEILLRQSGRKEKHAEHRLFDVRLIERQSCKARRRD
jgi:LacI family transcriptional regulator